MKHFTKEHKTYKAANGHKTNILKKGGTIHSQNKKEDGIIVLVYSFPKK